MGKKPSLFGLRNTNRDFSKKEYWGKNQFNSSFPAALACYMYKKEMDVVYIKTNEKMDIVHEYISVDKLFRINPLSDNTYFAFESPYMKYQKFITGLMPRNDLVIQHKETGDAFSTFEIKLTALPDNQTCDLEEKDYGSELVIRPDTIIYQACSILKDTSTNDLKKTFGRKYNGIEDWSNVSDVLPHIPSMKADIYKIAKRYHIYQKPLILQPVWKTKGKSPILSENCLDIFVWSDLALIKLFEPSEVTELNSINRQTRTLVWLFKMLFDYTNEGIFDGLDIIDVLSFNTKNDKAFAVGGKGTQVFMKSNELLTPRITKSEIKNIVLGGGQNLLSPERRFDAILFNSTDLFTEE